MVAFPIKMLLALTVLGWIVILMPAVMRSDFAVTFAAAKGLLVR